MLKDQLDEKKLVKLAIFKARWSPDLEWPLFPVPNPVPVPKSQFPAFQLDAPEDRQMSADVR